MFFEKHDGAGSIDFPSPVDQVGGLFLLIYQKQGGINALDIHYLPHDLILGEDRLTVRIAAPF